jgi:hypothetical protein
MAMSPWRKLETGEVLYYPWISKSSAYLANFDAAKKIQIFNELLLTIFYPIFYGASLVATGDKPIFSKILILSGGILLAYLLDIIFRSYIIRNLSKFDLGKLNPDSRITKVFPQTNLSKPLSSIFRSAIGLGLSVFILSIFSLRPLIIALVLFLALMVYNIREGLKIRIEDWSPDPVL